MDEFDLDIIVDKNEFSLQIQGEENTHSMDIALGTVTGPAFNFINGGVDDSDFSTTINGGSA